MSTTIYILDIEGYDARGGCAKPFATVEGAKADAGSHVKWEEGVGNEGNVYWFEDVGNSLSDMWTITPHLIGP